MAPRSYTLQSDLFLLDVCKIRTDISQHPEQCSQLLLLSHAQESSLLIFSQFCTHLILTTRDCHAGALVWLRSHCALQRVSICVLPVSWRHSNPSRYQ